MYYCLVLEKRHLRRPLKINQDVIDFKLAINIKIRLNSKMIHTIDNQMDQQRSDIRNNILWFKTEWLSHIQILFYTMQIIKLGNDLHDFKRSSDWSRVRSRWYQHSLSSRLILISKDSVWNRKAKMCQQTNEMSIRKMFRFFFHNRKWSIQSSMYTIYIDCGY